MSALDFIGLALIIPLVDFLFIQDSFRSFLDDNSHFLFLFPSEYNPKLLLAIYFSLIYLLKNIFLAVLFFIQQLLCKKLQSLYVNLRKKSKSLQSLYVNLRKKS